MVKCEIAGPGQMMLGSIQDEIDVMKVSFSPRLLFFPDSVFSEGSTCLADGST